MSCHACPYLVLSSTSFLARIFSSSILCIFARSRAPTDSIFVQTRNEDTIMLAVHNARERTVSDFVKLFKGASPYFQFEGITGGTGGAFQSLLDFGFKTSD